MSVQAFRPQLAVESLDEAVVRRFAGPGEVERDLLCIGPQIKVARDEFAAIVGPNRLWVTDRGADPFQRLNHTSVAGQ